MRTYERVWALEVFSINCQRFADHGLAQLFFDRINRQAILEVDANPWRANQIIPDHGPHPLQRA